MNSGPFADFLHQRLVCLQSVSAEVYTLRSGPVVVELWFLGSVFSVCPIVNWLLACVGRA